MQISCVKADNRFQIKLKGRFDYETRRDFDVAVKQAIDDAASHVQVNLQGVEYMDSSALGMLLVFRDKAQVAGKQISLVEAQGFVKKILDVANFDKLFQTASR